MVKPGGARVVREPTTNRGEVVDGWETRRPAGPRKGIAGDCAAGIDGQVAAMWTSSTPGSLPATIPTGCRIDACVLDVRRRFPLRRGSSREPSSNDELKTRFAKSPRVDDQSRLCTQKAVSSRSDGRVARLRVYGDVSQRYGKSGPTSR